ncbi:CAMK family protein kinase [Tritrichomonas foetus]|uniref:CAMK family protein kinase n=1 Tax=Tritrichomonas foetus TaxID=1144522 RepID=A0A1J4KQ32_9EUKA|nr:CAMK family protein kinase [Tritrichomonas foetus]|eukprot:OHT11900.1 CAMK family protein kinase [Tritrichomonas foetus]
MEDTISKHHYKVRSKIGIGGYSSVYLVFSERYQQSFAIKIIPIQQCKTSYDCEIQSLIGLNHPNIIKMYEHFKDDKFLYIVFDYCPNGSLMDEIDMKGKINEPRFLILFREVCTALRHCHSKNIAHHDMKPANVLLDKYGRCVLADFNLSQNGNMSQNFMGSRVFMAPEQVKMEIYDPLIADIWSLGVTLYMMAAGDVPWPLTTLDELDNAIIKGVIPFPPDLRPEIVKLISVMLNIDCSKRPTIDQILTMEVFPPQVPKYGSNRIIRRNEIPECDISGCKSPEIQKRLGMTVLSPIPSRRGIDGRRRRSNTLNVITIPKVTLSSVLTEDK